MNVNNFNKLKKNCASNNALLVAVTKTRPNEEIQKLYELDHKTYGENRVSEFLEKKDTFPDDVSWHFIGHLQRKKVKKIIGKIDLIHSVDSIRLLKEIEKRSLQKESITNVLLQFHIADEESKYGFLEKNLEDIVSSIDDLHLENTVICGVMGMATNTDNEAQIRNEFKTLKRIFSNLKKEPLFNKASFKEISMGMSNDFTIALEEGSTMVRVGSLLF